MAHSELPCEAREYGLYIDGEQRTPTERAEIDITFPLTGDSWATVPQGTWADVQTAVTSAHRRFESDSWQGLTATERGELLFDIADVIEEHVEELARLETLGNGKLLSSTRSQVESLPEWFRYYGGLADKVSGRVPSSTDTSLFNFTRREPYGVVGAITPWNSPLKLATYKIAPALAAGNTLVLKPSEESPVSTIRLAELAREAGLPAGALNVVTGFGDVGAAITDHDDVRKIAFTGGLETGKQVGSAAGSQIVSVVLELGGKSPNVVFPDAEFKAAVDGAITAIFAAAGQSCIAGSRLFLHESIHDEFVDALVSKVEQLTVGDPFDEATDIPPIATADQFEKIEQYVDIAREEGATLVTGGEPADHENHQLLYEPTVFTEVTNDMRIAQEEVFGPVLSVIPFETEDEVIELANETNYGLAAGVWTSDLDRAMRFTEEIEAGTVWVNTYRELSFETPFGGYKKSGIGREKGTEAIDEYLQSKSVRIKRLGN